MLRESCGICSFLDQAKFLRTVEQCGVADREAALQSHGKKIVFVYRGCELPGADLFGGFRNFLIRPVLLRGGLVLARNVNRRCIAFHRTTAATATMTRHAQRMTTKSSSISPPLGGRILLSVSRIANPRNSFQRLV